MINRALEWVKEIIQFENLNKSIFFSGLALLIIGAFTFFSASIGFLNKVENEDYFSSFVNMQFISFAIGLVFLSIFYFINLKLLYKSAKYMYAISIVLGLLIFIPGLEISHGGGARWINVFGFSLQPADIIKFSAIIFYSYYLMRYKKVLDTFKYGLAYLSIFMLPVVAVFFLQKDLGSLAVIFFIVGGMYFLNTTKFEYIFITVTIGLGFAYVYSTMNPYIADRLTGYKEESYQTKQSMIALGSGGFLGRGYAQSVQKFFHLPEPAGDSIYAVLGEEMGFVGTATVALLFFILIMSGLMATKNIKNIFIKNIIYGIILLYFAQFILNTGSMTKVIPLSGDTLPFFSKGGTALIMNMLELGLLLKLTRKDNFNNTQI